MIKAFLKGKKALSFLLITIYLIIIFVLVFPLKNYELHLKGGLINISSEIEIVDKTNSDEFSSLYIIAHKSPTLFQLLLANLSPTTKVYHNPNTKNALKSSFQIGQLQEIISYQSATINAYEQASKIDENIKITYQLVGFVVLYTTKENLKTGDVITKLNDTNITSWHIDDVYQYLSANDNIEIHYLDNGISKTKTIIKNEQGKFGITLEAYHEILTASPMFINKFEDDAQIGPSGGLMQALSIYATLIEKSYNLKISGTGTIDTFGNVGEIGGVAQKIYTANNKVDIFFCPEANKEEALKAYNKLKNPRFELVVVKTFAEAVDYLNEQD